MKISKELIISGIIIAVLFGGGGFFAGAKYQQTKRGSFFGPAGMGNTNGNRISEGQNMPAGFRGGATSGEIISSDEKSITVKLTDGSSKIIFWDDKTQINKASEGTKDDLKVGEKLTVFGTDNSDGSVTAQNIQLNPILREQNLNNGQN
jgi:hypothetical protein